MWISNESNGNETGTRQGDYEDLICEPKKSSPGNDLYDWWHSWSMDLHPLKIPIGVIGIDPLIHSVATSEYRTQR
jgi:hypothetical protein